MLTKQYFFVIEGIDGAGKTTVIQEIIRPLLSDLAVYTRDPGGTLFAEKIRNMIVNHVVDEHIHPLTEALLFYAARTQMVDHIINPALCLHKTVVCDRFSWSTWAYQYAGRGLLDASTFHALDSLVPPTLMAPIILYLDISPDIAIERIKKTQKKSKFDLQDKHFFTRVRDQYLELVHKTPNCYLIDASLSLYQIKQHITSIMQGL
jgi:dTMP kinase